MLPTPQTEKELLKRADNIAGESLGQLASRLGLVQATNLKHHKGWVGHVIERYLGVQVASQPGPDFPHLGVELKTIPLNRRGEPRESTFLCTVDLKGLYRETWESSAAYKKIARVLWVPVEGDPKIPLAQRRIGTSLIWSPSLAQTEILRTDWNELTDLISMGQLETITARHGRYLQIRPKGANARSLCWGVGQTGKQVLTLPRGFYLRTSFTRQIVCLSAR